MSDQICCQGEINHLEKKLEECKNKLKLLKENYEKSLIENLKKDIIIEKLEKKIQADNCSEN